MTCIEVKNKGIRDLKDMTFSMSVGMVGRSSKPGERVLCSELPLPPPPKNPTNGQERGAVVIVKTDGA